MQYELCCNIYFFDKMNILFKKGKIKIYPNRRSPRILWRFMYLESIRRSSTDKLAKLVSASCAKLQISTSFVLIRSASGYPKMCGQFSVQCPSGHNRFAVVADLILPPRATGELFQPDPYNTPEAYQAIKAAWLFRELISGVRRVKLVCSQY